MLLWLVSYDSISLMPTANVPGLSGGTADRAVSVCLRPSFMRRHSYLNCAIQIRAKAKKVSAKSVEVQPFPPVWGFWPVLLPTLCMVPPDTRAPGIPACSKMLRASSGNSRAPLY